jgi:hypothetical protein
VTARIAVAHAVGESEVNDPQLSQWCYDKVALSFIVVYAVCLYETFFYPLQLIFPVWRKSGSGDFVADIGGGQSAGSQVAV